MTDLLLDFIERWRVEIFLTVIVGVFIKTATTHPNTQPLWSLVAFVLLGYLDWYYIGNREDKDTS